MAALRRLIERRGIGVGELATAIDAGPARLRAMLDGGEGDPELLRRLAPVLGLHAADLIVIAGGPVPPDLAAANDAGSGDVGKIVADAAELVPEHRRALHDLVRGLPVLREPPLPPRRVYPDAPGGLLMRLLANRNIRPYNALLLILVGNGPAVSHATILALGLGRVELTPRYVTAFAAVLGIEAADLGAITGVEPRTGAAGLHPDHAALAELAWDARHLTGEQRALVSATAWEMAQSEPTSYCPACRVYHERR